MSLKSTKENYKKAKAVFITVDDVFNGLQSEEIEQTEFLLNQSLNNIKKLKKYLRNVDVANLSSYPDKTIEAVTKNLKLMDDAAYFLERFFLQAKYANDLLDPIKLKYIEELNLPEYEMSKWGGSKQLLVNKFIGTITHQDNIKEYENKIKRMIIGTMTKNEFRRIFDVIKFKMIPVKKKKFESHMKIPTLEEYQELNEDFFNPFDEEDLEVQKKPKHISDKGQHLKLRKETFNLARVEFTKRPGGEYTVLAKTQFARGEIVEICPTIILGEEAKTVDNIKDIIFEIDKEQNQWALVLGYGSLYRHGKKSNVDYAYNRLTKQMYFITKNVIKLGEELTINYGQDYWTERMTYNTFGDEEERTDKNQGMPVKSGKIVPNDELEESEVQPNAADIKNTSTVKAMSSPKNPANPVISGVAIIGSGQS